MQKPEEEKIDYNKDLCINALQFNLPPDYIPQYNEAISDYIDGNWDVAKKSFEELDRMKEKDGPLQVIMKYMKERNYKADNWVGYRKL